MKRDLLGSLLAVAGSPARPAGGGRDDGRRATVAYADGSSAELGDGPPELERLRRPPREVVALTARRRGRPAARRRRAARGRLRASLRQALRYYLDKYRFETDPDLLRALGERLAEAPRRRSRTRRIAGPALGAVALAASASMASGVPFIIVRGETKGYGTGNRIEGPYQAGEVVCLVEDVVTSGGALAEAVAALRDAGLVVRPPCASSTARRGDRTRSHGSGVRLPSLYRASDLLAVRPQTDNPHG